MKILLVDQFSSPTPYQLHQEPESFEALCAAILAGPQPMFRKAKVLDVSESYSPPDCTTAFCADENGMAKTWKYNWDSSG